MTGTDVRRTDRDGSAPVRRAAAPLVASGLVVELGGRRVLDDIDLALDPGTFTAVTGSSGAGKTTLLWALSGALVPTGGEVSCAGRPVGDRVAAARAGISLVPQGNALVASLTARENVVVAGLVLGRPAREARARADDALRRVGLADSADHLVEETSGGQQQRLLLARSLALAPAVLLADEPTSELDAGNREAIVALLAEEADAGALVVMTTHDPWCAEQAQAEYHLEDGRLSRVR